MRRLFPAVEIQETSTSANHASGDQPLSGKYTWRITNWSRMADSKQYSDKFEIGTYIW
jgi:hypothetical protein